MKSILFLLSFLLLGTVAFAQQPGPPYTTPPTFPQDKERERAPDTKAPAPGQQSAAEVEDAIRKEMAQASSLKNAEIEVLADDNYVVLEGNATAAERDLALSIAESHAGDRRVMDKIRIHQRM